MLLAALFYTLIAFTVSEILGHWITKDWIIDVKNGINGNPDLFGNNATFLNRNQARLDLDYHFDLTLFIIPIIALLTLRIMKQPAYYQLDAE